jgi:hypothetical protein
MCADVTHCLMLFGAAGMSDTEQVLACLHADALLLKSRLELKLGMQEAECRATARQQRLQATLQKRDQQADIFGARTRKERRLDAAAVEGAGRMPQTAEVSVLGMRGAVRPVQHC